MVEAEHSELLCDFLHRGPASLPPTAAGPQGLEKGSDKALRFGINLDVAKGFENTKHSGNKVNPNQSQMFWDI